MKEVADFGDVEAIKGKKSGSFKGVTIQNRGQVYAICDDKECVSSSSKTIKFKHVSYHLINRGYGSAEEAGKAFSAHQMEKHPAEHKADIDKQHQEQERATTMMAKVADFGDVEAIKGRKSGSFKGVYQNRGLVYAVCNDKDCVSSCPIPHVTLAILVVSLCAVAQLLEPI